MKRSATTCRFTSEHFGVTMGEAYCGGGARCPVCGRRWNIGSENGKGTLRYRHTEDRNGLWIRIPMHKAADAKKG